MSSVPTGWVQGRSNTTASDLMNGFRQNVAQIVKYHLPFSAQFPHQGMGLEGSSLVLGHCQRSLSRKVFFDCYLIYLRVSEYKEDAMGYAELSGVDDSVAQPIFKAILDHEDTTTMLVIGLDHASVVQDAKEVASQSPDEWWVVWVQNPGLLTDEQRKLYIKPNKCVCVLNSTDEPVIWLGEKDAQFKSRLLEAFVSANEAKA